MEIESENGKITNVFLQKTSKISPLILQKFTVFAIRNSPLHYILCFSARFKKLASAAKGIGDFL